MGEQQLSILASESTRKAFLTLVFFLFLGWMATAQHVHVTFEGNKRTKADFLMKVLAIDTLNYDADALETGIQRLKNLPILVGVRANIQTSQERVAVAITIEEGLVTWPLINFGGVVGNRWFLLGLSDFNLSGRAIQSTAFYRNIDGEHNAFLSVHAPFFRGSSFGGGLEIQRYAAIEPLFFGQDAPRINYVYSNINLAATLSYLFDYQHRIAFGFSYLHEDYEAIEPTAVAQSFDFPARASKDKYVLRVGHDLNRINFHGYEREGWSFVQQFQLINDFGSYANPFMMYWMEGRFFERLNRFNLAVQGRLGLSSNAINPFAPFVLDSQLNIRGAGNRVDRGTATAVLNTELRMRLFQTRKLATQGVVFSDLGNWRKPGGSLDELAKTLNLQHFVGGGVRLIYTKSQLATLRIDYGVNTQDRAQRGFVVGVGQFF